LSAPRRETPWLATEANLSALTLSGQWIDLVHSRRPPRGIVLDMDSSVSPTHGEQERSVWNGHYRCTCYHPLFMFNQFGDLERCVLRGPSGKPRKPQPFAPVRSSSGKSRIRTVDGHRDATRRINGAERYD
jgi:Transposase DDE domain group 1